MKPATSRRSTRASSITAGIIASTDDVHRQDVEIVRHVAQREQADQRLAGLAQERLDVQLEQVVARAEMRRGGVEERRGREHEAELAPVDLPAAVDDPRQPTPNPWRRNEPPKASAEAKPEQNTNISAASLGPKRAGIHKIQSFRGVCAT